MAATVHALFPLQLGMAARDCLGTGPQSKQSAGRLCPNQSGLILLQYQHCQACHHGHPAEVARAGWEVLLCPAQHSGQDSARFQAALALREAALRQWPVLPPESRAELRSWVLHYLIRCPQHTRLPSVERRLSHTSQIHMAPPPGSRLSRLGGCDEAWHAIRVVMVPGAYPNARTKYDIAGLSNSLWAHALR